MDLPSSHYLGFCAFIQLSVALNFGLVYLDRRSSLLQLKRRLFDVYKAGNNSRVDKVSKILKKYKKNTNYPRIVERYHTKTKQYHSIVTSDWDDEHEISFFPALGVIYGFYSIALLFLVCFFDLPDTEWFYHNQFLTLSQLTVIFSLLMIIRSWKKDVKTKIIPTCLLYAGLTAIGWFCCKNGWVFFTDIDFTYHYHWYVLLSYLPIVYCVVRIILIFLRKTFCIIPMLWWASYFDNSLNQQKSAAGHHA